MRDHLPESVRAHVNSHDTRTPVSEAEAVERVAYAIGRVIAMKTVAGDPKLRNLDGLGKASAVHELATNMARELGVEAMAALNVARRIVIAPPEPDA